MKRALVLLVLGLAAALTAAAAFGPFGRGSDTPVAAVQAGDFERWVSADGTLRAATSTPLAVPSQAPGSLRIAWLAPEGTYLEEGDLAARLDPTELERTVADRRADLESNDLRLDKQSAEAGARLGNLERDARVAERELEHSREFATRDEVIYSRAEILESRIDQELASVRLEEAREGRRREETLGATDRELLAIERRKIAAELDRAETALAALEVRAPHAGFLVYKKNWRGDPPRVGDTVFRGYPLAELPRLGEMEVEAWVLEADAGGLAAGDPVRVHLEAHPGAVYEGEVRNVEAIAKPRHPASPVQYFTIAIALAETDPELMKPGQRVRAEILLERVPGAFTVPRQAVFEQDGASVVYVQRGGDFEPVEVTPGSAGRGRIVVAGELEAGDRVALRDPTAPTEEAGEDEDAEPAGSGPALPGGGP